VKKGGVGKGGFCHARSKCKTSTRMRERTDLFWDVGKSKEVDIVQKGDTPGRERTPSHQPVVTDLNPEHGNYQVSGVVTNILGR